MEGYGFRVLVVENDPSTRYVLAEILAQEGYNVFAVEDGLAALDELKKRHYDVILADYQMPLLNGLTLLALSRKLVPETQVILLSSAHPLLERVAIERGAFTWIRKPASARQVLATIHAAAKRACESSAGNNARDPRLTV